MTCCYLDNAEGICRACKREDVDHPLCHAACLYAYFARLDAEVVAVDLDKLAAEVGYSKEAIAAVLGLVATLREAERSLTLMQACSRLLAEAVRYEIAKSYPPPNLHGV